MSEALDYHRATNVVAHGTDEDEARTLEAMPSAFKEYGDAERTPLETSVAGPLLDAGAGVVRSREIPGASRTVHFRAYSSAGARYPIEAYVAGPAGLYSFDPLSHALVPLRAGDARPAVAAAVAEPSLAGAGALVILTGIHARTGWKYMERGYRHVWWDAGTMLANLLALAAVDGLAPRLYTAFVDEALNAALGVDGTREAALAVLALGAGAAAREGSGATVELAPETGPRYARAERLHEASGSRTRRPSARGASSRREPSRRSTAPRSNVRCAAAARCASTRPTRSRATISRRCSSGRSRRSPRMRRASSGRPSRSPRSTVSRRGSTTRASSSCGPSRPPSCASESASPRWRRTIRGSPP